MRKRDVGEHGLEKGARCMLFTAGSTGAFLAGRPLPPTKPAVVTSSCSSPRGVDSEDQFAGWRIGRPEGT
jgi:hypothetical protein